MGRRCSLWYWGVAKGEEGRVSQCHRGAKRGGRKRLERYQERNVICVCIYIYYIHPELRISNYPFGTGKVRGSTKGARRRSEGAISEYGGAPREHEGALGEHWGSREGARGSAGAQQVGA